MISSLPAAAGYTFRVTALSAVVPILPATVTTPDEQVAVKVSSALVVDTGTVTMHKSKANDRNNDKNFFKECALLSMPPADYRRGFYTTYGIATSDSAFWLLKSSQTKALIV